jgi:hypothetical protein
MKKGSEITKHNEKRNLFLWQIQKLEIEKKPSNFMIIHTLWKFCAEYTSIPNGSMRLTLPMYIYFIPHEIYAGN